MNSNILQFKVIASGLYTTVQDSGRYGYQKYGVPVSGCLDKFSSQIANILVGNDGCCALLEMTMTGAELVVLDDAFVAITGAEVEVYINKKQVATWASIRVSPGDIISIGQVISGCRIYLAVTGGIQVPKVMGSRSCYAVGKVGGTEGRPLKIGDKLHRAPGKFIRSSRSLPGKIIPSPQSEIVLRAIPGPQSDYFDTGLEKFFSSKFIVSPDANRVGYRLEGPEIMQKEGKPSSIISESSIPGGVQIPPNGLPIILLGEQTVGGYTKIATVISSDLHLIGQASPGDRVRFQMVDLETAHTIKKEKTTYMKKIKELIQLIDEVETWQLKDPVFNIDQATHLFKELYPECFVWSHFE